MRALLVSLSLLMFATPAMAKPSDWDDVIEKPGDRAKLPPPSKNRPDVIEKANKAPKAKRASEKEPAKAKAAKAKKAKKAARKRR